MGTPILRSRVRVSLAHFAILLIVMLVACETDPAGPGATVLGHLQIKPVLETSVDPALLGLDEIHVTVIREWDSTTIVDTTVAYDPTEDDVFGWVLSLDTPSEMMIVRAEVLSSGVPMFASESTLVVDETVIGASEVNTVHLPFIGPGWNISSLEIDPGDSLVSHGDLAQFRVAAIDDSGDAVTDFVVVWETTDPSIATIDSDAVLQAPAAGRTSVKVIATTPTGIADSANVRFLPTPDSVVSIQGDADSVEVGTDLPLVVQVLGSDGLGVEQVTVMFTATDGAVVADAEVVTDLDGFANTVGTVGTSAGVYEFEAVVEGVPGATLNVVAVAGPGEALQFTIVPAVISVNVDLEPAVEVSVVDAFGNVVLRADNAVTLSLEPNALEALLVGTTTGQTFDGTARFGAVRIDKRGSGFRLLAEADGLTSVVSEPFDVSQSVEAVELDRTAATFVALADTIRLEASAFDGVETPVLDARFQWTSSNGGVATVDDAGLVTAVGNGTAIVTATSNDVSAAADITVSQEVASVVISPREVELTERGATEQVSVTVFDANGFAIEGALVEWSSSDAAVAAVNQSGVVVANGDGTATITAVSGEYSDEVPAVIYVTVVEAIVVSPETSMLGAFETTASLSAEARDSDGAPILGVVFVWSSSDESLATVDDNGIVTAHANGSVAIFAAYRETVGSSLVEVSQVAVSVDVSPTRVLLGGTGASALFDATVSDANEYPIADAEVTWSSSNDAVVTVNATSGEATAVDNGAATITASSGEATGTARVDVDIPMLETIIVTPGVVSLAALNETVSLSTEARDNHGTAMTGVVVTWASSALEVATVDEAGEVTALSNGVTTISATSGEVVGHAQLTVSQEVVSITVIPSVARLVSLQELVDLSATAWDAGGSEVEGVEFDWVSSAVGVATVGATTGSVVAESNGSANVLATVGDVSGSAAVTVSQEAHSIAVTPESASMVFLGDSVGFSATAWDAGGTEVVGADFNWVSSDDDVAMVGSTGWVSAVSNGPATINVSVGEASATADVLVAQEVASATVTPDVTNLMFLGESADLNATAWDEGGSEVVGVVFTWVSSVDAVATVGATGRVSAVSNGSSTVTATASVGAVSASAEILVSQEMASVAITPTTANLASLGESVDFTATAYDAGGNEVAGAEFSWVSSSEGVATIGLTTGSVIALSNGAATITATVGELSGNAAVTVSQTVASVMVTPTAANFVSLGESAQFDATALDARDNLVADAEFRWESSSDGVATVGPTGSVAVVADGTTTITATAGEVSGAAVVTVEQEVASVTVTPSIASLASLGESSNFTATARDAGGFEVTDAEFSWESSANEVATVGPAGTAVAESNGSATITVTAGGASASAGVNVSQQVVSIAVTPEETNLVSINASGDLVASAMDARGNEVAGVDFTWASSDQAVATVESTGTVSAVANGSVTITATSDTVAGSATVEVQQVVESVVVTPPTSNLVSLGESVDLDATAWDAGGSVVDATFSWASSNDGVATVGETTGLVIAEANGPATISAMVGGVSGSAQVVVSQVVDSVAVSPEAASLVSLGDAADFSATAWDAGGSLIDGAEFSWGSSAVGIATVGAAGTVSAVSNGSATITATLGAAAGSGVVTVAQEVVSLTVSPPTSSLASLGATVDLVAIAWDAGGSEVDTTVSWASSTEGVATVGGAGSVSAVSNGSATITASVGNVDGSAEVTVMQVATSVEVTPFAVWFGAIGETEVLTASVRDALGSAIVGAAVSWDVDGASGVVTVGAENGLVTAVGNGETGVVATSGNATGTAAATVQQVAASVEVTPGSVSFNAIGDTETLSVLVRDLLGHEIVEASVSWTIDGDPGVADVGVGTGVLEALGNGAVSVVATSGGVFGTASVAVAQVAASVEVTPAVLTLLTIGATEQLTATVFDANGHALVGAAVVWAACPEPPAPAGEDGPIRSTGVPGCAVTVDENGVVTAVSEGLAAVTATHGDLIDAAQVTVSVAGGGTGIEE